MVCQESPEPQELQGVLEEGTQGGNTACLLPLLTTALRCRAPGGEGEMGGGVYDTSVRFFFSLSKYFYDYFVND